MTENQTKVIELSSLYEKLKSELDDVRNQLATVLGQMEINSYFQNPSNGAVYKVIKPKGTFISYRDVDYERTAFEGESRGSLSKKEAKEKGYDV